MEYRLVWCASKSSIIAIARWKSNACNTLTLRKSRPDRIIPRTGRSVTNYLYKIRLGTIIVSSPCHQLSVSALYNACALYATATAAALQQS